MASPGNRHCASCIGTLSFREGGGVYVCRVLSVTYAVVRLAAVASVIIVRHRATDLGPGLQNILRFIVRLSMGLS